MTRPFDIPKALIWKAFQCVKANGGAAGVDRESIEQFESRLGDNLYKLWNRLCSGSYFPPPVKGVPIPKKSGGVRMLGVPTVADRVAQTGGQAPAGAGDRPDVPSELLWLSTRAFCP
ncbi:hypothetical protein [Burkholderia pyrrocinia]|uniref:Group II intron reverse transcriptase/maturase n=1 Tax=Burkholderia pyrrocinia TaxID=60550 RepID=A0ABZ3BNZ1_BURPY